MLNTEKIKYGNSQNYIYDETLNTTYAITGGYDTYHFTADTNIIVLGAERDI